MRKTLIPPLLLVVILVTACSAASTLDVPTYRGDEQRSGVMPGPGPVAPIGIRWRFEAGGPIGSQVVVVGGTVDLLSTDGRLYALDLATGAERWHVDVGARAYSSPTTAGDLILVGADDGMHALRATDGAPVWTAPAGGAIRGTAAVVDDVAICISTSGIVTALDVRRGTPRWTLPVDMGGNTSVAAAANVAVIGLADGRVLALDARDGTELWTADIGDGGRIGTPTIAGEKVYVASLDGGSGHHLAALDLATGRLIWKVPSPGDVAAYSPALADGLAVFGSEDRTIAGLEASSGKEVWHTPAPGVVEIVAAIAGDTVYSASNGGVAFALDAASGTERWRIPIRGVPYGVAVTSGLVLVGTSAGILYAIGAAS